MKMTIQAPNGKSIDIEGDRVPSAAELHQIFAGAGVDTGHETPDQAVTRLAAERAPGGKLDAEGQADAAAKASLVDTAKRFGSGFIGGVKQMVSPTAIAHGVMAAGQAAQDMMSPTPEGLARNTELVKNAGRNAFGFVRDAVTGNLSPERGGAAVANLVTPMAAKNIPTIVKAALPEASTVANAGAKLTSLANDEVATELAKHSVIGATARAAAKVGGKVLTRIGSKPVPGLEPRMANKPGYVPGEVPPAPSENIVPRGPVLEGNATPPAARPPMGPTLSRADLEARAVATDAERAAFDAERAKPKPLPAQTPQQAMDERLASAKSPNGNTSKAAGEPLTQAAPVMSEKNLLERLQGHKEWDSFKKAVDDLSDPEGGKLDSKKIVQAFTKESKFGNVFADMGAKTRAQRQAVVRAARGGGMGKLPQVAIDEVDAILSNMSPEQAKNYYYTLDVHKNPALGEYVRGKVGISE